MFLLLSVHSTSWLLKLALLSWNANLPKAAPVLAQIFDPKIGIGTVISVVTTIFMIGGSWYSLKSDNKALNDKVDAHNKSINEKVDAHHKDINDKVSAVAKDVEDIRKEYILKDMVSEKEKLIDEKIKAVITRLDAVEQSRRATGRRGQ